LSHKVYFPVNSLSGHTLQVRKDGLMSWEAIWREQPVASIKFRSNHKQVVETSLGSYCLKRKGIHVSGRMALVEIESGEELADGLLMDRNMQLSLCVRGSGNRYLLKFVYHDGRWAVDAVDGARAPIMRLVDTGTRMRWEADVDLDFDKLQSTDAHMLLAVLICYWMQDRAERSSSLTFGL